VPKVLTDAGFKSFDGVRISENSEEKYVINVDGVKTTCTKEHRVKLISGNFIEVDKLTTNDILSNNKRVNDIGLINSNELVYDLINVDDTHAYITNNLTSHNCVYLDEFAFVEGADDFYTSTYPVISSGKDTKIIITSTPNGMNLFYKLWMDGINDQNDFNNIRVDWWEVPHYDQAWKETTIRNIGEKKFSQEYANSFFGSSGTLIDGEKLAAMTWVRPLEESENIKVWEKPIEGHSYIALIDVSEGAGSDYSVMNIIDITETPYKQVCQYRNNKVTPLVFPEIIERLAKKYNESFILVEVNSIGAQVANILYFDYEYENMIISNIKAGDNVISFVARNVDYGLRMTKKSKRIGCSNLKSLIENDLLLIQDFDAISELQTFSKKGQSYEAEDGKHDDVVMTLVLLGWLSTQDYFKDLMDFDSRARILEMKMESIEDDLTPMGFFNNAAEEAEEAYSIYDEYNNVF